MKTAYPREEAVSGRLNEFIHIYLHHFYGTSVILEHRAASRESKHLNQLLYDNERPLELVFDKIKGQGKVVTLPAITKFFTALNHPDLAISARDIEECFVFSMMTVLYEDQHMKRYEGLQPVEFLEMLCRLAIGCITM